MSSSATTRAAAVAFHIPSPELEAILAHSRDFKERLDNFGRRIERLEATVRASELERGRSIRDGATTRDKLLSATKLASELGVSPQWIRDHWRELGGRRDGGPTYFRYWFDLEHAREEFFAIRGPRPEAWPAPQPPRRRRLNSAPLLPVKREVVITADSPVLAAPASSHEGELDRLRSSRLPCARLQNDRASASSRAPAPGHVARVPVRGQAIARAAPRTRRKSQWLGLRDRADGPPRHRRSS